MDLGAAGTPATTEANPATNASSTVEPVTLILLICGVTTARCTTLFRLYQVEIHQFKRSRFMSRLLHTGIVVLTIFGLSDSASLAQTPSSVSKDPVEVFDQRIRPIFRSPNPSSCVQCHLAAVDLKNYILPSAEKTFASLRDQGLVDLKVPSRSKILTLIQMGEKDRDAGAKRIHAQTRQREYQAFAAWIEACSRDPKMRSLPSLSVDELARPSRPDAVIRHARRSRIVDSFARNIWSQRMRCFPCHTPHEVDTANPRHQAAVKTLKKFKTEYGDSLVQRLEIFRETPEETMQYLIDKSRKTPPGEIPLLDLKQPRRSLLLMKPMAKLPPKNADGTFPIPANTEPMFHLGGLKLHQDDQSYKSFISWISDYAQIAGDRLTSVADLPDDNWYGTKLVIKLVDTPESWTTRIPVQMFVHSWNAEQSGWNARATAFTQGIVTPRHMVAGSLFLLANPDPALRADWDPENATLPRGRYLVKVYVDSQSKLSDHPTLFLGQQDFYGQTEIQRARWRTGFRQAESVSATELQRP